VYGGMRWRSKCFSARIYLLMAKLHYTNNLANLCNTTDEVGQQVGSVEFISRQVIQQVRVCVVHQTRTCWPTSCQFVAQFVRIEFGDLHVDRCSFFTLAGELKQGGRMGLSADRKNRKVNYDEGRR
jgi:hypothetical protein